MDAAKRKKILKRTLAAAAAVLIAAGCFFAGYGVRMATEGKEIRTLRWVIRQIERYYYEDFTAEELIDAMTDGLGADLLDRYSGYYSAEEYRVIEEQSKGNRSGIGVTFSSGSGLTIYRVSGNSPAERAGIRAGDVVLALDAGEGYVEYSDYTSLLSALSAVPEGREMKVRVLRRGEPLEFSLKKEKYTESCVFYADREKSARFLSENGEAPELTVTERHSEEIPEDAAYLRLTSFTGKAAEQFASALALFHERGKHALILDLRGNGGGSMSVLEKIASHVAAGTKDGFDVARAKYKNGKEEVFRAPKARFASYSFRAGGIAVLADSGSASASEALIGAMLDYGSITLQSLVISARDETFGSATETVARTYGKGIMQTTFPRAGTGEAIKLTTATIHWPISDACIHGTGIGTVAENRVYPTAEYPADFSEDAVFLRAAEIVSPDR